MGCVQKTPGIGGRSTTRIMLVQNHVLETQVKSTYRWVTET
jgi:hypothetical protein